MQGRIIHEAGEAEASGPADRTARYYENLQSRTTLCPEISRKKICKCTYEGPAVAFMPQGPERPWSGPATMRVWNKDLWHLWPAKMLDANLGWLWTNVIKAAIDQWRDSMRSCMHAGGRHFEHMLQKYCVFVLCGSSEHFMKMSMKFGAFDGYSVVSVKSWIRVHMYFRCFNFNKVAQQH